MSERALETLVPILGDRVKLLVALIELSHENVDPSNLPMDKQLDQTQESPAPMIR
jgi:hypothetical protein